MAKIETPGEFAFKSEILTAQKRSGVITKVIRKVVRHILEGEEIKEKSKESLVVEEIFKNKDINVQNIRDEVGKFIHLADKKTSLSQLYDKLSAPPFNLTGQAISLIFLDVLLKHGDMVSIFEKGLFQLEINPLLFDRLVVNPHKFEVQKNIFTDERKNHLESLAGILKIDTNNLLEITKTIVFKVRELDKYTKQTEKLSSNALRLRNSILSAKEPYKLVFNDIPISLGIKGYKNSNNEFFKLFADSIMELDNNYALLLMEIEAFLFESFGLKTGETARQTLADKVTAIEGLVSDTQLRIVVNCINDNSLPFVRWLEKLATVINGKNVPKNWSDNDLADFKQKILYIAGEVKRLEGLIGQADTLQCILNMIKGLPNTKKMILMDKLRREEAA